MQSCAFIGQNMDIYVYNLNDIHAERIKELIQTQVEYLYANGIKEYFIGCVPGVEMWTAESIIRLMKLHPDIKLYCVIPYKEHFAHWPQRLRKRYLQIMSLCTENLVLCTGDSDGCEDEKNQFLVDHSDILIAVHDSYRGGKSAVGHVIEYAKDRKKDVFHLHMDMQQVIPVASGKDEEGVKIS